MGDSKPPFIFDYTADVTSGTRTRGVERIPLTSQGLSEERINALVACKVTELAIDGKRICSVPKRLQDGIALDWVRDERVKLEDLRGILRKIGLKSDEFGFAESSNGTSRATDQVPVDFREDLEEPQDNGQSVAESTQRSASVPVRFHQSNPQPQDFERASTADLLTNISPPRRQVKDAESDDEFKLYNVSASSTAQSIRQAISMAGIPPSAILGIQLRDSPTGRRFAVISLARGHSAARILGKLSGQPSVASSPTLSLREEKDMTNAAVAGMSQKPTSPSEHVVIDLTDDASQSIEEESTDATIVTTDVQMNQDDESIRNYQDFSSHAFFRDEDAVMTGAYDDGQRITADAIGKLDRKTLLPEHRGRGDSVRGEPVSSCSNVDAEQTRPHRQHSGPQTWLEGEPRPSAPLVRRKRGRSASSSEDSSTGLEDSDDEHDVNIHNTTRSARMCEPESLATRLLHGTASFEDVMTEASEEQRHRIQAFLAQSATSRAASDARNSRRHNTSPIILQNRPRCSGSSSRIRSGQNEAVSSRVVSSASAPKRGEAQIDNGCTVVLSKPPFARGRRLLVPADMSKPIAAVYMRGDIQFIDQDSRRCIPQFSLACDEDGGDTRLVTDAALLDDNMAVVVYKHGPAQVSCITLDEKPRRIDLAHRGHTIVQEHRVARTSYPNAVVSALAVLDKDRRQFLTGGGDGCIRVWTLEGVNDRLRADSRQLEATYFKAVRCLAFSPKDGRVLHASGRRIGFTRLDGVKSEASSLLSAEAQQIHIHPHDPFVVILEVDHMDQQVQIFDLRRSNFNAPPCIHFGYRDTDPSMEKRSDVRYSKGSTHGALFARGYYGDGTVRVWDYRKPKDILMKFEKRREVPISHTVMSGDQVIAYGGNHVTFWGMDMQSP